MQRTRCLQRTKCLQRTRKRTSTTPEDHHVVYQSMMICKRKCQEEHQGGLQETKVLAEDKEEDQHLPEVEEVVSKSMMIKIGQSQHALSQSQGHYIQGKDSS